MGADVGNVLFDDIDVCHRGHGIVGGSILHNRTVGQGAAPDVLDFLTQDEISSEIKGFISAASVNSAAIEYSNIKATVVIEDGTLKEFKYSYDGNVAELNIKVAIVSVNGKGAMHVDAAYTGFAY